jgi:hypothetical protein
VRPDYAISYECFRDYKNDIVLVKTQQMKVLSLIGDELSFIHLFLSGWIYTITEKYGISCDYKNGEM